MFALELDRRSRAAGWGIVSNAAHPGTTLTGLYAAGPNMGRAKPSPVEAVMTRLARWGVLVQGVDRGLLPALYAATSPDAQGGRFYGPDGFGQFTGGPAELKLYRPARDEAAASRLWDVSPASSSRRREHRPRPADRCRFRGWDRSPIHRAESLPAMTSQATDNLPAPAEGILVTLFITVRDVVRSRDFYARVLGGTVVLNENPCIVRLSNSWIIMNPGGPPTPDKPGISVVDYQPGDTTSIFLNLRVADIHACYEQWKANGAQFLTPPIDRTAEIRCYLRDPDGYLIEIGQSTGLLRGRRAMTHPDDPTD